MKYNVWSMNPVTRAKQKEPYVVEAHDLGTWWSCTCPHWQIRLSKTQARCKHIDKAVADSRRNEQIQEDIAAQFEKGYPFSLDDDSPPKPDDDDDIKVASAI